MIISFYSVFVVHIMPFKYIKNHTNVCFPSLKHICKKPDVPEVVDKMSFLLLFLLLSSCLKDILPLWPVHNKNKLMNSLLSFESLKGIHKHILRTIFWTMTHLDFTLSLFLVLSSLLLGGVQQWPCLCLSCVPAECLCSLVVPPDQPHFQLHYRSPFTLSSRTEIQTHIPDRSTRLPLSSPLLSPRLLLASLLFPAVAFSTMPLYRIYHTSLKVAMTSRPMNK